MAYKFAVFHFRPTFTTSFAIPADWDKKKLKWDNGKFFYKGKQIDIPQYITDAQDQLEEYKLADNDASKSKLIDDEAGLDDEGVCYDFDCKNRKEDEEDSVETWVKYNIACISVD